MTPPAQRSSDLLFREFARVYAAHRCPGAPAYPDRAFELAFRCVYPEFRGRLSREEFLSVMYEALWGRPGGRGLFQTFDPTKYHGRLTVEGHFLNLFKRKLKGRLGRAVARPSDTGRPRRRDRFRHRPELGLLRGMATSPRDERARAMLPLALSCLTARERAVIHLVYWADLSRRKVGALLGMDHKTVGRVHDEAIRKLRRAYGVEVFSESVENRAPKQVARPDMPVAVHALGAADGGRWPTGRMATQPGGEWVCEAKEGRGGAGHRGSPNHPSSASPTKSEDY